MRMFLFLFLILAACSRLQEVGKAPAFTPLENSYAHAAMYASPMPEVADPSRDIDDSSLVGKSGGNRCSVTAARPGGAIS
jgi:flagellar L-ring protein FlgH